MGIFHEGTSKYRDTTIPMGQVICMLCKLKIYAEHLGLVGTVTFLWGWDGVQLVHWTRCVEIIIRVSKTSANFIVEKY